VSLLTLANICYRAVNTDMSSMYRPKVLSCKSRTWNEFVPFQGTVSFVLVYGIKN